MNAIWIHATKNTIQGMRLVPWLNTHNWVRFTAVKKPEHHTQLKIAFISRLLHNALFLL